ncbi:MAG: choice-of-anchor Q domain-containing protein, partial [Anaerolineales bacterium]|nr:hypothetical protein [Anaerolineales bacterium]MDW8446763.1 choice-of-anchor Q domain-containing protein [Anaerolineales bacterium]
SNGVTTSSYGSNSYHVVTGNNVNNTAALHGFVITGGQANNIYPNNTGGGMQLTNSSPTLTGLTFAGNDASGGGGMSNSNSSPSLVNVIFRNNSANFGGGMDNRDSEPILTGVTFRNNTANYKGGGMSNYNSSPLLTNVTFENNSANQGGGGMSNDYQSDPELRDVVFLSNTATQRGGGMLNEQNSAPQLISVTLRNNQAQSGGGIYNYGCQRGPILVNVLFDSNRASLGGGGISNQQSSLTLQGVTFSGNTASSGGGMANWTQNLTSPPAGSLNLTNVIFSNNAATYSGGGMLNMADLGVTAGSETLTNVLFSGNSVTGSSGEGGGMFNDNRSPLLRNVTFAGNSAPHGGGIVNSNNSHPTLRNVLIWGNSSSGSTLHHRSIVNKSGSNPKIDYSNLEGCLYFSLGTWWLVPACGQDWGNNTGGDPLFVNPGAGDWRLRPGSPMIDAGTNGALPDTITTDLDGKARIEDGNNDSLFRVDIGAYEVQILPMVSSITRADPNPTSAASVNFTVTFSEAVSGVDASDFSLATTETLSGVSITSVAGTGTTRTVTVNTGTGWGTLRLDLKASGTGIQDAVGNSIIGGFIDGEVYTIRFNKLFLPLLLRSP